MFLQAESFEIMRQRSAQIVAPISAVPKRKRVGNQVYKISSSFALRLDLIYLPLGLVERPTVRVKGLARSHQELNIT